MIERYLGAWIIARTIVDADRPGAIVCSGSALLRASGAAIAYDEAVTLELDGKHLRATRSYRFATRGRHIVATFTDGAPFFRLTLDRAGRGTATHHCGDDVYALALTLRGASNWHTRWEVQGTKRLSIATEYTR